MTRHDAGPVFPDYDRIIEEFVRRRIVDPGELRGLSDDLKTRAFWLAGQWDKQFVKGIQDSLETAMRQGQTFAQWLPNAHSNSLSSCAEFPFSPRPV